MAHLPGVVPLRALALSILLVSDGVRGQAPPGPRPEVRLFFQAASPDEKASRAALEEIARLWRDGDAAMIVDLARFMRPARPPAADEVGDSRDRPPDEGEPGDLAAGRSGFGPPLTGSRHPSSLVRSRLIRFLEKQTGQRFGDDLRAWRKWIWSRPYEPHPDLPLFKARLYGSIDPRMASFFAGGTEPRIRLDEVDWGGVELAVVYCTLCGTVIPYGAESGGRRYTFGTSGLLYRSNKLMFEVPERDGRLPNKAEVLTLRLRPAGSGPETPRRPLALWAEFLKRNPIYQLTFAGQDLVIVTTGAGANRVYAAPPGTRFIRQRPEGRLQDAQGRGWRVTEDGLISEVGGERSPRVPARRAFWFGWYAQFPDTALVRQ